MVCDEEDEGLDFDTLNKINKDTDSSFDAYDVNRYPKREIERISYQDQEEPQVFDGSVQQPVKTNGSHFQHSKQSSGTDEQQVSDGDFQTFLDPSKEPSKITSNSSIAAAYKSFGSTSHKQSQQNT